VSPHRRVLLHGRQLCTPMRWCSNGTPSSEDVTLMTVPVAVTDQRQPSQSAATASSPFTITNLSIINSAFRATSDDRSKATISVRSAEEKLGTCTKLPWKEEARLDHVWYSRNTFVRPVGDSSTTTIGTTSSHHILHDDDGWRSSQ